MPTVIRVSVLVLILHVSACQPGSASETGEANVITGIATDGEGNPIEGVRVSAKTGSMGDMLWWAFEPSTISGPDGSFGMTVPFGDIRYSISAEKAGFLPAEDGVIPDEENEIRFRLERNPRTTSIAGHLMRPGGRTVPGAEVYLIGESGHRVSATTDEDGIFTWDPLPDYVGQAVPLVRWEGLVSPIRIIRDRDPYVSLDLVPPARVTGVCREKETGAPVVGATVIMRPCFLSGFRLETTSKDDGTFALDGVPPGEYGVTAMSATHFIRPPRGYDSELPERHLRSGETTSVTLDMQPMATVKGCVLDPGGRPVPGALVCTRSTWLGDYRDQNVYIASDEDGRFSIATGHLSTHLDMHAYHSRFGMAAASFESLTAGQVVEGVELRLGGAARVRGLVTDPEGKPVKDVTCVVEWPVTSLDVTRAGGRFDLGPIPLDPRSEDPIWFMFRAPRPETGELHRVGYPFEGLKVPLEESDPAPQFFHHKIVKLQVEPDADLDLEVVLEPTELLDLTGTVVDASANSIAEAKVYLFTGDASPENWINIVRPVFTDSIEFVRAVWVDAAETDTDGRWRIRTVRERAEANPRGSRSTDWSSYCIGVEAPDGRNRLLCSVEVPEGENRREVTIILNGKDDEQ